MITQRDAQGMSLENLLDNLQHAGGLRATARGMRLVLEASPVAPIILGTEPEKDCAAEEELQGTIIEILQAEVVRRFETLGRKR